MIVASSLAQKEDPGWQAAKVPNFSGNLREATKSMSGDRLVLFLSRVWQRHLECGLLKKLQPNSDFHGRSGQLIIASSQKTKGGSPGPKFASAARI